MPGKPHTADAPRALCLEAELERKILHGLQCEWRNSAAMLPPEIQQRFRMPVFRLADYRSRWGTWRLDRREIALQRGLAADHSWDSLLEILRHEMAHQLCDEVLGGASQTAHGAAFQEACRLLGANPAATAQLQPLDVRIRNGKSCQPVDRITRRVYKLLALADSHNPNEAASALAKAHDLIAKHHLPDTPQPADPEYESLFMGQPALRQPREAYRMAQLLSDHYHVCGIWVPAYVVLRGKMGRVLEISAQRHHLQIAAYVYDFIQRVTMENWHRFRRKNRHRHPRRTDFALGIIEGVCSRLSSQKATRTSRSDKLPTTVEDPLLKAYLKKRHPYQRTISRGGIRQDPAILNAGRRIGEAMQLADGIAGATEKPPPRLPAPNDPKPHA